VKSSGQFIDPALMTQQPTTTTTYKSPQNKLDIINKSHICVQQNFPPVQLMVWMHQQ